MSPQRPPIKIYTILTHIIIPILSSNFHVNGTCDETRLKNAAVRLKRMQSQLVCFMEMEISCSKTKVIFIEKYGCIMTPLVGLSVYSMQKY